MNNSQSKKNKYNNSSSYTPHDLTNKTASATTTIYSIDEKHTEMLNWFNEIEDTIIPKLKNEINKLIEDIKILNNNQIDEYMDICDKIKVLKKQVKNYKNKKKNYMLDNSKYIFEYFENKKNISTGVATQQVNILNSFFRIKPDINKEEHIPNANTNSTKKYINSKFVYQKYWKNVSNNLSNLNDFTTSSDICENCNNGELIPQEEEGILICNNINCGSFITHIIDNAKPNNKEPPNEVSYTAYIRLNHFKEILSQFQAKETTQIPDAVITAIKNRIKKERITDISTITYDRMREILRKLSLNKYFEHIQYINSIFGIKPPLMSEELHETLCVLFIEIQKPWALHCPLYRTNFFNYTYTLYQLCVLLGQTQYLPYISQLKDLEKQREQDQIWKRVCNDLGWKFFPTV
jgi:hypothetical protein